MLLIFVTNRVRKAAMASDSGKKLFVGPRFRRIRQQLGLSQTQMAEGLEISPSYINLIELNQRPVTAQLLLRLAETYDPICAISRPPTRIVFLPS
jgi:DNA-binding XRE family transcriptional regulator